VELMLRLQVDREPLEKFYFPLMIKTTKDLETFDPVNIINFEPESRLFDLKKHCLEYLKDTDGIITIWDAQLNAMLKQYVVVSKFLVEHGIFNKIDDIKEIVEVLVKLLNGTIDFYSTEQKD
jgi:hypothetical protein